MNFFDHQRAAKGSTLKLVFLFVIAVVAMVAGIEGAVAIAMAYKRFDASEILGVVVFVTAITLLVIAGRMFFKMLSLRQGGRPSLRPSGPCLSIRRPRTRNCGGWSTSSRRCLWPRASPCRGCS